MAWTAVFVGFPGPAIGDDDHYRGEGKRDPRVGVSFEIRHHRVEDLRLTGVRFRCQGRRDRRSDPPALASAIRIRRDGSFAGKVTQSSGRRGYRAIVGGHLDRHIPRATGWTAYRIVFRNGDRCRSAPRPTHWTAIQSGLLFSSGFEEPVEVGPPEVDRGYWRFPITGADQGFAWESDLPWGGPAAFFPLMQGSAPVDDYVDNRVDSVLTPRGTTRALYMAVKRDGSFDPAGRRVRDQFPVLWPVNRGYISYWIRFQPNLAQVMPQGERSWRRVMVWRNRGSETDYQITLSLKRRQTGDIRWDVAGQRVIYPDPSLDNDWHVMPDDPPVRAGSWIHIEAEWIQDPTQGLFRAWADGRPIVDHRGRTRLADHLTPQIFKVYTGANSLSHGPAYQWIDDVFLALHRLTG